MKDSKKSKKKKKHKEKSLEKLKKNVSNSTRDEWMMSSFENIATVSRSDLKTEKNQQLNDAKASDENFEKPGLHSRELNPYWKNKGDGLPDTLSNHDEKHQSSITGDGGLEWLRRAYYRCFEIAKEKNLSPEEVAAKTHGSLEALEKKLCYAIKMHEKNKPVDKFGDRNTTHAESRRRRNEQKRSRSRSRDRNRRHKLKTVDNSNSSSDSDGSFISKSEKDFKSKISDTFSKHNSKIIVKENRKDFRSSDYRKNFECSGSSKRFINPENDNRSIMQTKYRTTSKGFSESWKQNDSKTQREKKNVKLPVSDTDSPSESDEQLTESRTDEQNSPVMSQDDPSLKVLSDQEMNELGAKLVRAEILGQQDKVLELKKLIESSRKFRESNSKKIPHSSKPANQKQSNEELVILTRSYHTGMTNPVNLPESDFPSSTSSKRKRQKVSTHGKSGQRERYFADDDKYDLHQMVKREKLDIAEDQNQMFARLASKMKEKTDQEDYQFDDAGLSKSANSESQAQFDIRQKEKAINEHRKMQKSLEKCNFCFENVPKHLVISIGLNVYLCLPPYHSMVDGYCLIVPMQHVCSATAIDENIWEEMQIYRKILTKMFKDKKKDVVFIETVLRLKKFPHTFLEVIPMPLDLGEMAPIYFKKAIMEAESEWSQNKKLIELKEHSVKDKIPRGFPYFSASFGLDNGFAHVIEDESDFPSHFGREIVAGILDIEPLFWRKPQKDSFEQQCEKVLTFSNCWKPYDWTHKLKENSDAS